jgi:hypothetical protein
VVTVLAVASLLGPTGLSQPAYACSTIVNWETGPVLGARSKDGGPIPRNAAFLWKGTQQPVRQFALAYDPNTQMPIMGHVVRQILQQMPDSGTTPTSVFIAKPDEQLPLNGDITISDGRTTTSYTVGDYVDDAPPETPRITGGAIDYIEGPSGCDKEDSCGSGPWTTVAGLFTRPRLGRRGRIHQRVGPRHGGKREPTQRALSGQRGGKRLRGFVPPPTFVGERHRASRAGGIGLGAMGSARSAFGQSLSGNGAMSAPIVEHAFERNAGSAQRFFGLLATRCARFAVVEGSL